MSDFDVLQRRFAELPEPSQHVRAAARARLQVEMAPARSARSVPLLRRRALIVALAVTTAILAPLAVAAAVYFRDFPRPADVPRSAEPIRIGPKLVSAEGQIENVRWRLVTYQARDEDEQGGGRTVICQQIELAGQVWAAGGGCGIASFAGGVSLPSVDVIRADIERTWLVGRVLPDAQSVTLVLADGRHLEAETYPTPSSLHLPYNYYVAVEAGAIGLRAEDRVHEVVARAADGRVLAQARRRG